MSDVKKAPEALGVVTVDQASTMSAEVFASTLRRAHRIGMADGRVNQIDKAVKDSKMDEDVIRSYLRGWNETGPMPTDMQELTRDTDEL